VLNRVSKFFYDNTKVLFIVLLFLSIVIMYMAIPIVEDILQADKDMVLLDDYKIFSPEKTASIIRDWGENGRRQQIWLHLTWDLLFPIVYSLFIGFLLSWFAKRAFAADNRMQKINLLSGIGLFDLIENTLIMILVIIYPLESTFIIWLKIIFTIIKYYIFGPLILLGLLSSLFFIVKNKLFCPINQKNL
jgi:hypothetical protein